MFKPEKVEKMKNEAIIRMQILGLSEDIIAAFKDNDEIMTSYSWGEVTESPKNLIPWFKELKERYGGFPYHVVETETNIGLMQSILYVSAYDEYLEEERNLTKEGYPYAYVINEDINVDEFGTISVEPYGEGLRRIL